MPAQIRLSKEQLTDLELIRDAPPAALELALGRLRELGAVPIRPAILRQQIVMSISDRPAAGEALFRHLLSLQAFVRQMNLTAEELFDALRKALSPPFSGWSNEETTRWGGVEPLFQALFELDVVVLTSKALDLSYEHAQLLQRARIVTDLRPVFNRDASDIQGAVIAHTLLLRYDNVEGEHTLSLSVDEKDIRSIQKQCERALAKSATIAGHLEKASGIKPLIPGSDDHD